MSGSLGGMILDLDANLAPFEGKLDAAQTQARSWLSTVDAIKPEIDANITPFSAAITSAEAELTGLAGTATVVPVSADTAPATAALADVEAEAQTLAANPPVITPQVDTAQATAALADLQAQEEQVAAASSGAGSALGGLASNALSSATGFLGAQVAMRGLSDLFGVFSDAAIGMNSTLETTQLQFETLMGSADQAKAHVADLFNFAKVTPFTAAPILEASRTLEVFGRSALDTMQNIKLIGDASAAVGAPINEIAFWFGRLYLAIQNGEPLGMAARYLERLAVLSPQTATEIQRMQKAGASTSDTWQYLIDSFGRFDGAMQKQQNTWKGLTSTISDLINLGGAQVFKPLFTEIEDGMKSLIDRMNNHEFDQRLQEWQQKVQDLADNVHDFVVNDGPALVQDVQDIATAAVNATKTVGDFVTTLHDLKSAADDIPGLNQLLHFMAVTGPFTPSTDAKNAQAIREGADALAQANEQQKKGIDLARQYDDAYQSFINKHVYDDIYAGIGGEIRLQQDATQYAKDYTQGLTQEQAAAAAAGAAALQKADDQYQAQQKLTASQQHFLDINTQSEQASAASAQADQQHTTYLLAMSQAYQFAHDNELTFTTGQEVLASRMDYTNKLAALQAQALTALQGAAGGLVGAQDALSQAMSAFSSQGSEYQGTLNAMKSAYDAIQQKQKDGQQLTQQDQAFLADYDTAYARLSGGIQDATIQEGYAAQAKADVMKAQDNLNDAIARGETNLQPYNDALAAAQQKLNGAQPDSPLKQAMDKLNTVIGSDLKASIDNLVAAIDTLNGKRATPTIGMDKQVFERGGEIVDGDMIQLNAKTATPHVNLDHSGFDDGSAHVNSQIALWSGHTFTIYAQLDYTAFDAGMVHIAGFTPHSPAKEGPMAFLPSWDFITETLPAAMDAGVSAVQAGSNAIANSLPVGSSAASTGPLAATPDWSGLTSGVGPAMDAGASAAQAGATDIARAASNPGVTVDYSWLTKGIDLTAKDAQDQVGKAITGWLNNIDQIVSGDAGKQAQKDLAKLFDMREALIETNAPQAAIDEINKEITTKQAEIQAIGALVGTDVVQGMIAQAKAEEAGQKLLDAIKSTFQGINLSGADFSKGFSLDQFLGDIPAQIQQITALRDAARQLGFDSMVAEYTQKLADLNQQAQIMSQVFGTEAVQAFVREQEAEAKAKAEAEAHKKALEDETKVIQALATGGSAAADMLKQRVTDFQNASKAFDLGKALGVSHEQLDALAQGVRDAGQSLGEFKDELSKQLLAGAVDPQTLQALAQAGGQWFQQLYDSLFGDGALAQMEQGWKTMSADSLNQLVSTAKDMTDHGKSSIDAITKALQTGAIDAGQAVKALIDISTQSLKDKTKDNDVFIKDEVAGLESSLQQLYQQLQQALVAGTDPTQILANIEKTKAALDQLKNSAEATAQATADVFHGTTLSGAGKTPAGSVSTVSGTAPLQQQIDNLTKALQDDRTKLQQALKDGTDPSALIANIDQIEAKLAELGQSTDTSLAQWTDEMAARLFDGETTLSGFYSDLTGISDQGRKEVIAELEQLARQIQEEWDVAILEGLDTTALAAKLQEIQDLLKQLGAVAQHTTQQVAAISTAVKQVQAPGFDTFLSSLLGFQTSANDLSGLITDFAGKGAKPGQKPLDLTSADEQLALLQKIYANPELFPSDALQQVATALETSLKSLGFGPDAIQTYVNDQLKAAGVAPLSSKDFQTMGQTWTDALKNASQSQVDAIYASGDKLLSGLTALLSAPQAAPVVNVQVTVNATLDKQQIATAVSQTVTASVQQPAVAA